MRRTRQSGFTLTELVVTIVVFAVLAVVSIPSFVELPEEAGDIRPLRRVRLEGGVLFGDDGNGFVIDPRTGTLFDIGDTGGFTLATEAGYQVRLDVNAMARVQACVPAGAETLAGVPACD